MPNLDMTKNLIVGKEAKNMSALKTKSEDIAKEIIFNEGMIESEEVLKIVSGPVQAEPIYGMFVIPLDEWITEDILDTAIENSNHLDIMINNKLEHCNITFMNGLLGAFGEQILIIIAPDASVMQIKLAEDFVDELTVEYVSFTKCLVPLASKTLITAGTIDENMKYTEKTFSHAEGIDSHAEGATSHAEGYSSHADGMASHAEGNYSYADGMASHAEGNYSRASGDYSHAEGIMAYADGDYSHAEGQESNAEGATSHAEGAASHAEGAGSHAEGNCTHAQGIFQHVQGQYNISDTTSAHIVGNGDYSKKSNCHTIDWNGNGWFSGDVYVGSTSGTNKDAGSKKLLTEDDVLAILREKGLIS